MQGYEKDDRFARTRDDRPFGTGTTANARTIKHKGKHERTDKPKDE